MISSIGFRTSCVDTLFNGCWGGAVALVRRALDSQIKQYRRMKHPPDKSGRVHGR